MQKKTIDLGVVIPTLNEEHFVGYLLDSIIKQSVQPKEIVVVDAYSEDKTMEQVKMRQKSLPQLKFFQIPKFTVSRQRNFGVKQTTAKHLLFLDADMELRGKEDLAKYFQEVLKRKPAVAAARNLPNVKHWKNSIYFKVEDLLFRSFSRYLLPVVTGRNLYISRKVFELAGGFDEELKVGEDQELVQRIVQNGGKLIFLKTVKLYTSVRRIVQEGRRRYALKMAFYGLKIMLLGRKRSKVKYEFGNFRRPDL